MNELDINVEDEIIIKRIIDNDGKSKALINDNLVSLTTLKAITSNLFEIHSQFSEQGLLDNSTHLSTLDDFGNYQNELKKLSEAWLELKAAEKKYDEELSLINEVKLTQSKPGSSRHLYVIRVKNRNKLAKYLIKN